MDFIEKYRIKEADDVAYYIPDFVSESEEQQLLNNIYSAPKPKWKQLSNRRLQNWGGLPHPRGMLAESLPGWLERYTEKVAALGVFEGKTPNHALINEYLPGQGIMPHTDGPLFYPTITTINLGSHTVINFYKPTRVDQDTEGTNSAMLNDEDEPSMSDGGKHRRDFQFSLLLLPRSCLVLRESLYQVYLHGIDERLADVIDSEEMLNLDARLKHGQELARSTRVSLTIRVVPKVLKIRLSNQ